MQRTHFSAQAFQTAASHANPPGLQLWLEAQRHAVAGRLQEAQAAFSALLHQRPEHVPARLLFASVVLATGKVREAAEQAKLAARSLPDDPELICRTARCLLGIGETNATLACMRHPGIEATRSGPALAALAQVFQGLGLHADALRMMDRARVAGLDTPDFRYFRALQLQFNGRLAEAEAEMEACLRAGPTFGRASLTLARLRRQAQASHHVDFIRSRLVEVTKGTEDHAAFEFALHKELDDLGRLDEAWDALQRANAVMQARVPYDAVEQEALFEAVRRRFAGAFPAPDGMHDGGPTPIFIVGMPRSGTTLLERMLGNHSMVASAGELADFPRQVRWVSDQHGQALLDQALVAQAADLDFELLGRRYLEQSRWRADGRDFYIDKLPPNFMLLGFIRRALPQAKILHMVRDPMDVCFSNYRALFGDAYAYSYDQRSLAHHHNLYRRLMRHWHAVMPEFLFDVPYADLVRDTDRVCRDILEFCGLPFEPQCVDNTRNNAPVATLSSAQVRESVHARALGEWKRYEHRLQPLRDLVDGR